MRHSIPPLPGTGRPRRGLFVDHLGTLLVMPTRGYLKGPEEVLFSEDCLEALFHAGQSGWNVYLVGNEASVHRGQVDAATWEAIHAEILSGLRAHGICPVRSYICIDHPESQTPHNKDSVYRLPNTGAMYHAAQADGISLPHSWVIGDHTEDLVAGWRAGCHTAGVRTGIAVQDGTLQVEPEFLAENLAVAVREVSAGTAVSR
ncbi:MAG: HAD hydrolase-like protein [Planctomycetes bacterium]|nr:HAD hydrolase-like protein [Planctomycetota bacterium]MCB9909246.1 HAD hydrolase-like protein [Planctomycetota bacterium]